MNSIFRDLHTQLLRVHGLKAEAEQTAKKGARLKRKVDAAQKALDDCHAALKQRKVEIHEKEVSLKANQERIARYQKQRQTVTDKKQYDALGHEIDAVRQENNALEDQTLAAMGAVEEKTKELPALEEALKLAQAALAEHEAQAQLENAELSRRLAEAEAQVRQTLAQLEESARRAYERIAAARGVDALAPSTRKACNGCNMEVTGQQYNDLLSGRLVSCKSCARILYLPDE
jgi:predicted  nucleic acid-binding Zn-ribbon protein